MNDTMKNTMKKQKLYFYIALLGLAVSIEVLTMFIILAIRIDWEYIIDAILFSPSLFVSIYFILLHFKWKIVFERDKIIVHKPFCFPKVYPKEEVFVTMGSFLWDYGALWYHGKKIARFTIYDTNSHLTGDIKWKK